MRCQGAGCYRGGRKIKVHIRAELSHDGKAHDKIMRVDACITDLVESLYPHAAASCCGHEQTHGRILLHDGRVLKIFKDKSCIGAMPGGPWGYSSKMDLGLIDWRKPVEGGLDHAETEGSK